MTCTVAGLAKYLRDNITFDEDSEFIAIPECDFCIIDDDNAKYTLEDIRINASGWYGLKVVNGGFNSDCLVVMADYYGGGCANLLQIWNDGFGASEYTIRDLTKLILDTLEVQESARNDTLLIVEFPKEAKEMKYTVRLSALKYGEVYVDAESEEEAKDKAAALFDGDSVKWHSGELTDMTVEEEI